MLDNANAGVYDFENVNSIKKKSVRGLLRKRAKKYESESDSADSDGNDEGVAGKRKQKVVRKSMASAFKMIMSKKIESDDEAPKKGASKDSQTKPGSTEIILAKYKKKSRDLDEAKAKEDTERKKAILKEKQRLMGRRIPTKADAEKERGLAIVATKGVVQLFNAVAEFQTSVTKEAAKDERSKKKMHLERVSEVGKDKTTGAVGFDSRAMIEQIQSTKRKWKVLESDSEDLDGNIKIVDEEEDGF